MVKFINRKKELNFFEEKYLSKKSELIILYGRRRIGKTELLLNFSKNKKILYFLGRLESNRDTIKRFNDLFIKFFNDMQLLSHPLLNWDAIFDYLIEKSSEERLVLIIDEFPFLIERFPEIISVMQDKWDFGLKNSKIMLILSGSSVSMMEKYTLDYKSPLYGRRTGQWLLDKLDVGCLNEFFEGYNIKDLILVYSVLDMIPGYLLKFSLDVNAKDNIKNKILSKGEFLYEEVEILLREELRDPSNYMSIISSIAGGVTTFGEIHTRTQLDKSLLSKYLFILEKLGIIEKTFPLVKTYKSKLKAKGSVYFVQDNFFDFWFRFVYLNKQQLEKGEINKVLDDKELNEFVSKKFETFIIKIIDKFNLIEFTKIGRQWGKIPNALKGKNTYEIDIVALNEDKKEILFCECKWKDNVNAEKILSELKEKAKYVDWNKDKRKESYAVFAKSFSKKVKEFKERKVYCFDLDDIEKVLKK